MIAARRLRGIVFGVWAALGVGCSPESCPEGEIRGSDGECHRDPTFVTSDCLTEAPLSGTVRETPMAVNAFAFVEAGEEGIALIGFERSQDACSVVENHVSGFEYWHDGLVLDMSLRGGFEAGSVLELVESTAQQPAEPEMAIRVAQTDEWVEKSQQGQALVTQWIPGELLQLEITDAKFEQGMLEGDIRACYCSDLDVFWDILAPDI